VILPTRQRPFVIALRAVRMLLPTTLGTTHRRGGWTNSRQVGAGRLRLRNPRLEGVAERLAHRLELDPVEHVGEEAADDQPLGFAT
jgi:hypothetical protein